MSGRLRAGVAVTDITPPPGTAMAGFAARTEPSTGVHDALSARAVALERSGQGSIVVAADLVAVTVAQSDDVRRRVAERTGLPVRSVVLSVTHTHAGPHVSPDGLGPSPDPVYVARLEDDLVETAVRAWTNREAARIGHGFGEERTVAHNRRHDGGIVDPTVTVVRVDNERDETLAVLFSYSCHPVVLGPANLLMSADWPGEARRRVEERFPGAVAVYLQGCCGDVNTGHSAHDSMDPTRGERRTFVEAARIGGLVGDVAADVAAGVVPSGATTVEVTQSGVTLPFSAPPPAADILRLAEEVEAELRQGAPDDRAVVLRGRRSWLASLQATTPVTAVDCVVTAHRWGALTMVTVPGEAFVRIALDIRAGAPDADLLVLGYCNGVPGYVPYPPVEYEHGGYEVEEAHCFYGQPERLDPACGPALVEAARQAMARFGTEDG